ncbi:hypothetical protein HanXRQr2_Chr12g0547761 [Helianthus annuus]|uniref:Uncharacterized protein n=1 Tax=Helianthus annuus TaxID=4232 RepID=A0A251T4G9_HELAN|nr:hypothetical protein HanXRQr2_Chr12g0547761 [Helianthus annuus]KAJ0863205.1 hypothetical protein HanPSC8_Chr12g0527241 [Helianthus annuus]
MNRHQQDVGGIHPIVIKSRSIKVCVDFIFKAFNVILILIVLCDLMNLCSDDSIFSKTLDMKFVFFLIYSSSIQKIQAAIIR